MHLLHFITAVGFFVMLFHLFLSVYFQSSKRGYKPLEVAMRKLVSGSIFDDILFLHVDSVVFNIFWRLIVN